MKCTECKAGTLSRASQVDTVEVGTREFEGTVAGWRCSNCGAFFTDGPSLGALESEAARWLAENGFSTGEEIKFMRKVAGLRAIDLADLLGVSAETVSHWETGKHPPDRCTLATIGSLVLDSIDGSKSTQKRLRALGEPAPLSKVRVGSHTAGSMRHSA